MLHRLLPLAIPLLHRPVLSISLPLLHLFPVTECSLLRFLSSRRSRRRYRSTRVIADMDAGDSLYKANRPVNFRLCKVFGLTTELLEIQAENPTFHVLFIPGNPGVVSFYDDFVESLYEFLDGNASITAIGHVSHTSKDWESRRLFSLQEQIDHKIGFVRQDLQDVEVPIVLVGHSIGAYISLEILRKCSEKVIYCVGLYPFLALNQQSLKQSFIVKLAASSFLSTTASLLVASLGLLPMPGFRLLVSNFMGNTWSDTAIQAACTHLSITPCVMYSLWQRQSLLSSRRSQIGTS